MALRTNLGLTTVVAKHPHDPDGHGVVWLSRIRDRQVSVRILRECIQPDPACACSVSVMVVNRIIPRASQWKPAVTAKYDDWLS